MPQHRTNRKLLNKGLKILGATLLLLFLSPFIITLGFKIENKILTAVGVALGIFTIYLGFKGFKTLLDALFDKNQDA
ncbi:MAG: DUF6095 family protein [Flavobacteriaceae bacterium]|nr:DUF6095 family protein [Flavobacteriaceae bacterium]